MATMRDREHPVPEYIVALLAYLYDEIAATVWRVEQVEWDGSTFETEVFRWSADGVRFHDDHHVPDIYWTAGRPTRETCWSAAELRFFLPARVLRAFTAALDAIRGVEAGSTGVQLRLHPRPRPALAAVHLHVVPPDGYSE